MFKKIRSLFKRQSVPSALSSPEWQPYANFFPPSKAASLATTGRCLKLYSDFLIQAELKSDKKNHYFFKLLLKPNAFDNKQTFLERIVHDLLLYGNFIAKIIFNSTGKITSLIPYQPSQVFAYAINGSNDDSLSIHETGYYYRDERGRVFMPHEIFHIKDSLFSSSDFLNGLSRVYLYQSLFESAGSIQDVQRSLSRSGLRQPMLLSGLPEESTEQLKTVRDTIRKFFTSGQSAQAGVLTLPQGFEVRNLSMQDSAKTLQFLASKSDLDVCRIFGVPVELIARSDGQSQVGSSNLKESHRFFLKTSMLSFLTNIANSFSELMNDDTNFYYDISSLRPSDLREQSQFLSQLVAAKILTPTEAKKYL